MCIGPAAAVGLPLELGVRGKLTAELRFRRRGPSMPADLFAPWCILSTRARRRHQLLLLRARPAKRAGAISTLADLVPSYYDDPERMADRARRLGSPAVASVLRDRLPRTKRARSGELGEILASEYVRRHLPFD